MEREADVTDLYMVFDVESIGLHGEGFAVGACVVNKDGRHVYARRFACPPSTAKGSDEGRAWVRDNVPTLVQTHVSPRNVRRAFWKFWRHMAGRGAVLVADCAWPVEARFLVACVDDDPERRAWEGPYPLHDLASIMLAAGMDPLATYDRLPDEPQHDPLGDARQSARLLINALDKIAGHNVMSVSDD